MEYAIYSYSLCVSLTLMVFFGLHFIVAPVPDNKIYGNYLRSRRIIGVALLILAANYSVHFFAQLRFSNPGWACFLNLSTYFLQAWLFSSALTSLLDRQYLTRQRFWRQIGYWALYTGVSGVMVFAFGPGLYRNITLLLMALCFFVYAVRLARRLLKTYHRAVRAMKDYYSDDVEVYVRWMSRFTYWAAVFGVAVGGLTFLPQKYVFLWILSAIPFYIYLYVSYMNYLLFYEQVREVFEDTNQPEEQTVTTTIPEVAADTTHPAYYTELSARLKSWTEGEGYTTTGITASELASALGTNRTYLAEYIKSTYNTSFREWIILMRIEYAKNLLAKKDNTTIAEISESAGFKSLSYFTRIFTIREGCTPARWRKNG